MSQRAGNSNCRWAGYIVVAHQTRLSKVAVKVGLLYILAMIATLTGLYYVGDPVLLGVIPAVLWAGMVVLFAKLPDDKFHQSRVHPVISMRRVSISEQ